MAELEDTLTKTHRTHDMSVADLVEENLAAEARCEELTDEITDLTSEIEELRRNNSDQQAELAVVVVHIVRTVTEDAADDSRVPATSCRGSDQGPS